MPVRKCENPSLWLHATKPEWSVTPNGFADQKYRTKPRRPKVLTKTKNKSLSIGPSNPTGNFKAENSKSLMEMGGRWTTMRRGKGKNSNRRHESAPPAGSDSDD